MKNKIESIQFEVTNISMSRKERKFSTGKDLFTAYLTLENDKQKKLLEDFGLSIYTSKDGNNFVVVKVSEKLVSWSDSGSEILDTRYNEGSGYSVDGYTKVNIIKGNKDNNDFYRLTDIMLSDEASLTKNERVNPFA